MPKKQERIKKRNAGKCDSPCLQYYGIPSIANRNNKTPLQLSKRLAKTGNQDGTGKAKAP